jgi:hypothetical protein
VSASPSSSTPTIVSALRIIASEDFMQSDDGVASMAILEAADRLEEYNRRESLIPSNSTGKEEAKNI